MVEGWRPDRNPMVDEQDELKANESGSDPRAVEALLARYLPGLRAFIRLRSGPLVRAREESEDLAQSVCREILQNADRFQHGDEIGFRHWLFTTALRRIQNRHEYWKAQKRDAARDVPMLAPDSSGDLLGCYRSFTTPSQNAMAEEEARRIEDAFDKLSEEDREVITLSRIVGLSHREIGERTNRTEGAARVHLHRALIRLAELLDT